MRRAKQAIFIAALLSISLAGVSLIHAQEAPAQSVRLTLEDAIQRGLQANLRIRAAGTRVDEAAAVRERRFANLLPRARLESYANLQNRNLGAFGISAPGVPEVVPSFSNFDFRVYAEQPVIDRQGYHNWKATGRQEEAARQDYQDLRDEIVRLVAGLYLDAQAAAARVKAARSRVTTAEELHRLALERRSAGVATGVDVLRAQVELANAQQRLFEAENRVKKSLVTLARHIGMSPGTPLDLADGLEFRAVERPDARAATEESLARRGDYQALAAQREALLDQHGANRARYLPRLTVGGNYGGLGRTVGQVRGTGLLQATLSFTVFDRDREGEQKEVDSRVRRLDLQMADLRLGIEEQIRLALLTLESASEEVLVAQQGQELAMKELDLARERFQAGVTNNLEVISAQASVERAQENYILAVTRHTDAKMALARALGGTEKGYGRFTQ
jgi:outer membrane protein TolC